MEEVAPRPDPAGQAVAAVVLYAPLPLIGIGGKERNIVQHSSHSREINYLWRFALWSGTKSLFTRRRIGDGWGAECSRAWSQVRLLGV